LGVECAFQSQEVKDKSKATFLENYGVEHQMHRQETKDKIKATSLVRLGYEHNSQSPLIKQQKIATCLRNHGVENPQQNAEIAEKTSKSSYLWKDYKLPSGKIIQVQGYEPFALDELVKIFKEDEINTKKTDVPEIWWHDKNGKKRKYYVDIFIPSQNKCIEVKSPYTYQKNWMKIY
jgi:hypothetical protein